jgi:hypothetical protein
MKKRLLAAALLAALAVPSFAVAQDEGANTGAFHFGADLNLTTSYFFRGYNQEDTGLIFQPNVYTTFNAVDADDVNVDLKLGSWNSLHSEKTASDDIWYESDLYAIATVGAFGFNFNVGYTFYTYPGDAFETVQELGLSTSFNDTDFWNDAGFEGFTLAPTVGWYFEVDDGNGEEDQYIELGLYPSYQLDIEEVPVFGKAKVTVPLILGMSPDGYYLDSEGHNEFFGYWSAGVTLGVPLDLPSKYGVWTANVGANYIGLLADSAQLANDGGEDYELQGFIGISMSY